jgi:hypothetical protein
MAQQHSKQYPSGCPRERLSMVSRNPLTSAAVALLERRQDCVLVEKLTLVEGYTYLLNLAPNNATYQNRLRIASEELRVLVDREQSRVRQ